MGGPPVIAGINGASKTGGPPITVGTGGPPVIPGIGGPPKIAGIGGPPKIVGGIGGAPKINNNIINKPNKPSVPKSKTKPLFWEVIPPGQIPTSYWQQSAHLTCPITFDTAELEQLFT